MLSVCVQDIFIFLVSYKFWSSSVWDFARPPVTSSFSGPHIFLSVTALNTLLYPQSLQKYAMFHSLIKQ